MGMAPTNIPSDGFSSLKTAEQNQAAPQNAAKTMEGWSCALAGTFFVLKMRPPVSKSFRPPSAYHHAWGIFPPLGGKAGSGISAATKSQPCSDWNAIDPISKRERHREKLPEKINRKNESETTMVSSYGVP